MMLGRLTGRSCLLRPFGHVQGALDAAGREEHRAG